MKKVLAVLLSVMMLVGIAGCGASIADEWATIQLSDKLPIPEKGKLNIGSDLDDYLSGSIDNVDEEYYASYVEACIEFGYVVESEKTSTRYEAFNKDGYDLSLSYYSGGIHITFEKPDELEEIIWPTSGLGALLPKPTGSVGVITADSSKTFRVTMGETSIDGFDEYVKVCEDKGFTVDYLKQDGDYSAKNADGYRLNLHYLGCNRIEIMIEVPKDSTQTTTTTASVSDAIDPDFKEAMDSYEEFMGRYVDFMKKYSANPTDLSLLADYASFMSDYADYVESFDNWGDEDLNAAELAYYVDVQARVSKKLLEVTQ